MKEIIKKAPVLLLVISTGILLTVAGLGGKRNIYAGQEYDPLKSPLLALVFQGINEEKYPWQILQNQDLGKGAELQASSSNVISNINQTGGEDQMLPAVMATATPQAQSTAAPTIQPEATLAPGNQPTAEPQPTTETETASQNETTAEGAENGYMDESGEIQPFRESTYDEYISHISADIYGTVGVDKAREYNFTQVDESYFDDALFIGDSRTVGLRDYCDLSEHAEFLCETSLTIYKVLEQSIGKKGTVEENLNKKEYGKIYLSIGINELGRGTTEDFIGKYKEVVGKLREMEPDAIIVLQGIMKVSKAQNDTDAIFNNSNIEARNRAVATLVDNEHIFYVDVNEVVCDEAGNLSESYTYDKIHLLGTYNELIKQFLMEHGVLSE